MPPKQQNAVWDAIHKNKIDCIIGTQLIAKGHHVPNLTLVGIIDGDMGLVGGDLRGSEKAFQLLQQVGGRAGRDVKPGTVLIQTYQPENPLFQALCRHDRDGFLASERALRQSMALPPYGRLIALLLTGFKEAEVQHHAKQLATQLRLGQTGSVQVLGPAPALMLRLKSRYRYRILLKADRRLNLGDWLMQKLTTIKTPSALTLTIDVDPMSFN
jgi:primosomal protein N' (replication factor Y)